MVHAQLSMAALHRVGPRRIRRGTGMVPNVTNGHVLPRIVDAVSSKRSKLWRIEPWRSYPDSKMRYLVEPRYAWRVEIYQAKDGTKGNFATIAVLEHS